MKDGGRVTAWGEVDGQSVTREDSLVAYNTSDENEGIVEKERERERGGGG